MLPVRQCLRESVGWRIFGDPAALVEDCRAFVMPTFGSGQLFDYLRSSQCFEQIELCGLVTNMCVLSNAVLAKCAQPEVRIVVDAAACAAPDQEMHQAALKVLEGLQVEVINKK